MIILGVGVPPQRWMVWMRRMEYRRASSGFEHRKCIVMEGFLNVLKVAIVPVSDHIKNSVQR